MGYEHHWHQQCMLAVTLLVTEVNGGQYQISSKRTEKAGSYYLQMTKKNDMCIRFSDMPKTGLNTENINSVSKALLAYPVDTDVWKVTKQIWQGHTYCDHM